MSIQFSEIKNQLVVHFQSGMKKLGQLGNYVVSQLNIGLEYTRNDKRLAAVAFVVANIACLHLAIMLSEAIFSNDRVFGDMDKGKAWNLTKKLVALTFVTSLLVGMNYGLVRALQLTSRPAAILAYCVTTLGTYAIFRGILVVRKQNLDIQKPEEVKV